MRRFRPFQVRLPSGDRYWTVVDASYRPVADADATAPFGLSRRRT